MYAHKNNTNDRFIERNINVAKVNWQNSIINVCIHHRMNEITSEQDWLHSPSGVTGWFIRAQTSEVYVTGIVSHPEPKPSPSSFVDPVQILSPPPNPFKLTRFCYRAKDCLSILRFHSVAFDTDHIFSQTYCKTIPVRAIWKVIQLQMVFDTCWKHNVVNV